MKKKMRKFITLIIVVITVWTMNFVNVNASSENTKLYKLYINLLNLDTDEYTIELIDRNSNRTYETQKGKTTGKHYFAIAADMDEKELENYGIRIKFEDGNIKNIDSIKVKDLIDIDEEKNDFTYSYEYNVKIRIIPKSITIVFCIIAVIGVLIALIIALKKYKRRIK